MMAAPPPPFGAPQAEAGFGGTPITTDEKERSETTEHTEDTEKEKTLRGREKRGLKEFQFYSVQVVQAIEHFPTTVRQAGECRY